MPELAAAAMAVGGCRHLGLVEGGAAVDGLGLDLLHVPGHEGVGGLTVLHFLFRFERLGGCGAGKPHRGGKEQDLVQFLHGSSPM